MVDAQTIGVLVTAVSVTVAAIYYIMTLRTQQRNMKATLQTREAQLFMMLYSNTSSEEFSRHLKTISSTEWNSYEDFKAKVINDPEKAVSLQVIVSTWEGIGVLVRENLVDIKLIALYCAGTTRKLWEKFRPEIEAYRKEIDYSRYMSEMEYVYGRLMDYMASHPELLT
jgi:hypothetical protein